MDKSLSVTAAFFVILIIYLASNGIIQKFLTWVKT